MPDLRILKALGMTPADWGKLPIDGEERLKLREKASEILSGKVAPILSATDALIARNEAIIEAQKSDVLTRAGFEMAMVQQAKGFGEAVEMLRDTLKKLDGRMVAVETFIAELEANAAAQFGEGETKG